MRSQAARHASTIRRAVASAVRCAQTGTGHHSCQGPASHYTRAETRLRDSAASVTHPESPRSPDTTYLMEDGSSLVLTNTGVTPPTCTVARPRLGKPSTPLRERQPSQTQAAVPTAPDNSLAPNTRRAYATAWRCFNRWCQQKSISPESSTPGDIAAYLEHSSENNVAMATVKLQKAAIKSALDQAGRHQDNPAAHPSLKQHLRTIAQRRGRPQKQASPLDAQALAAIRATAREPRRLPSGRIESSRTARRRGTTDVALASLMREALLRISEASALTWQDFTEMPDGTARLLVRRSKTDQDAQGKSLYIGQQATQDVTALRANQESSDPIFGLSANRIAHRLKQAADHAGIPGPISGHSPRVGMAQDLAANGTELPALMTAGRWSSPAMPARYIENIVADRGAVAQYHHQPATQRRLRRG